jgi:hypothetical protein
MNATICPLAALPALPRLLDASAAEAQTAAPLASWNDGPAKQTILRLGTESDLTYGDPT